MKFHNRLFSAHALLIIAVVLYSCTKSTRNYENSENDGAGGNSEATNSVGNSGAGGANDTSRTNGGTNGGKGGANGGDSNSSFNHTGLGSSTAPNTGGSTHSGGTTANTSSSNVVIGGFTAIGGSISAGGTFSLGGSTHSGGLSSSSGSSSLVCTGGPTYALCNNVCVDLAKDAKNCRKCGHDCGYNSTCTAGVCSPVTLYTNSTKISAFDVDDERIAFSPTGILSCPVDGCGFTPNVVTTNKPTSDRFISNQKVAVTVVTNTPGGSTVNFGYCPITGCTSSNFVSLGTDAPSYGVELDELTVSTNHIYFSNSTPGGKGLNDCALPSTSDCTSKTNLILGAVATLLVVSDSTVFFSAELNGTTAAFYSCPTAELQSCVPSPMNVHQLLGTAPYKMATFGDELFFLKPNNVPPNLAPSISKCPRSGCASPPPRLVELTADVSDLTVDSSGIFWILGSSIQMCPLSGCVGGPMDVALNQGTPEKLRLNKNSVLWVNAADNTIRRVVKP
jgi:hypothetical protein